MHRTLILGMALLWPAAAVAQTAEARMEAALAAAAEADVPVSLLESKIAEGRAKRVPPERIAIAVEARLRSLVEAKRALDAAGIEHTGAVELAVAGDALEAGVSEEALIRVMRGAPEERRAVATAVLTQLVQIGYQSDAASARVEAALVAGAEALANLRAEAAAALRLRSDLLTPGGSLLPIH